MLKWPSASALRKASADTVSRSFRKTGKLKPQYALLNGQPEHHPEGSYCLRYGESGRRIWKVVGQDPDVALAEKLKREQILRSRQLGRAL